MNTPLLPRLRWACWLLLVVSLAGLSGGCQLLGVLADSLILTFGMDSAISRTLQLIAAKGEAASQIPIYMTQLFVAKAHEQVFDMLREMMMWMSQDEEWGREIRDVNNYYNLDRINTFSLRRKIAKHVIEAGAYAL